MASSGECPSSGSRRRATSDRTHQVGRPAAFHHSCLPPGHTGGPPRPTNLFFVAEYDFREVEERWQRRWDEEGTYRVDLDDPRPPYYVLCMYPYPSGPAHQGHIRNYTFGDLLVRHRTMQGHAVLSPFGFDSFGLPAENAAIKTGTHPRVFTEARIAELKASLTRLGAVYDWRREIRSHDPDVHAAGTRSSSCSLLGRRPGLPGQGAGQLVSRVPDGARQRAGAGRRHLRALGRRGRTAQPRAVVLPHHPVRRGAAGRTRRPRLARAGQDHAAQLDRSLRGCRVPHGRSPGRPSASRSQVFTTRPDTSFGMTYAVVAPEHPLVAELVTDAHRTEVAELRARAAASHRHRAPIVRRIALTSGAPSQAATCVNPFTGELVPIYVADYVLMGYGTGAIMAVPAEDERDLAFAQAYGLPIVRTVEPPEGFVGGALTRATVSRSTAVSSTASTSRRPKRLAIEFLEQAGIGSRKVNYRLRDWLISRQRYWGCPIPVMYCPNDGIVPVPADELPILLPDDVEFRPTGESPLRFDEGFLQTTCPICGGPAIRETDTMDTFVDSSWYFLRFCNPRDETGPVDLGAARHFMPVDQYIGGISMRSCTCSTPVSSRERSPTPASVRRRCASLSRNCSARA